MYFKHFPTIDYDVTGNGITKTVTDITFRVKLTELFRKHAVMFSQHDIKNWETPEILAHNIYGKASYHWIILLTNKYFNRYYEWPMTEHNLQTYVINKYSNPDAIHHYEISQKSGNTTTKIKVELADEPTATPVTNYLYESNLNEAKKRIKIMDSTYASQFITEFSKLKRNS